jgi:hypothetical protein
VQWPIVRGCWRSESGSINPGRSHRWLTTHLSTRRSNADCRPLLQQSSPIRGRVVSSDTECSSEPSTLHPHRLRCPLENQLPHTWNAGPQVPTPAASSAHPSLRRDDTTTPGTNLGGLFCQAISPVQQSDVRPFARPRCSVEPGVGHRPVLGLAAGSPQLLPAFRSTPVVQRFAQRGSH